jgi:hypothetical protein
MPRIKNIQLDSALTSNDKLLGSDSSGATRNFSLDQVATYIKTSQDTNTVYKHHQNNAATTWTITHNLDLADYLPHVNIKLSGGGTYNNIQAMGVVTYVSKDQLTIGLADSASGYAYIKA